MTAEVEAGAAERLEAELDLLQAMYPETLTYAPQARELKYSHQINSIDNNNNNVDDNGHQPQSAAATLLLRLPDTYPLDGFPEVIAATGIDKEDLRSAAKAAFATLVSDDGEEVLDALLLAFGDLVTSRAQRRLPESESESKSKSREGAAAHRTVVIWLHHLLNTNKRKLALNPSLPGLGVAGVTKPGYPGVLVFSGDRDAVGAHVAELRNQRWQAFQIRYDTDDDDDDDGEESSSSKTWRFEHGVGIREVESMGDVARSITDPLHQEIFLSSIGVK